MMLAHSIYNNDNIDSGKAAGAVKKVKIESIEISAQGINTDGKKADSEKENASSTNLNYLFSKTSNQLDNSQYYPNVSHLYNNNPHFNSHSNRASPIHYAQNTANTTRCPSTPAFSSTAACINNHHVQFHIKRDQTTPPTPTAPQLHMPYNPYPHHHHHHHQQYHFANHPNAANNNPFFLFNNPSNSNNLSYDSHTNETTNNNNVYKVNSASYVANYPLNNTQNFGKKFIKIKKSKCKIKLYRN